ncbi:DUF2017 family protein [Cellulomonas sp. PhB143]|uniref:DUF2017 family protein n=1 Tax=Cellulomonas sp. PhB143 TaxID=2485186 RepID=UPI000F488F6E|nr:DUF2017 family protein [Cellulomonas sp. PhB143]ROS77009.1 uncharacterized protein DUF2017 [Cellulomonas sp. PhB143]
MRAFRPHALGYVAELDATERIVLAQVVGDVAQMLQDAAPGTGGPDDPAVARLLPDASRDDAEVSAEFRRLTQTEVAAGKVDGLLRFARLLLDDEPEPGTRSPLLVRREDGRVVAAALTDLRLVLASRLGLETDAAVEALHEELGSEDDPVDPADPVETDGPEDAAGAAGPGPRRFFASVFLTAGWLQESLVEGMLADLPRG